MKYLSRMNLLVWAFLLGTTLARSQLIKTGEQAEARIINGGSFRPLIGGKDTQGTYAVHELTETTNYLTSLHRHNTFDESFYILEGYLTVYLDGKTHRLGPGTYVFIPRGTPHAQGNLDSQAVRFLLTMAPSVGFEGFLYDREALVKRVKPDSAEFGRRLLEIVRKYDLELLGPSPIKR